MAGVPVGRPGFVEFASPPATPLLRLQTVSVVPPKPPAQGTLFLWPGLQPGGQGKNFLPIHNGVLQPVLTWGPTCAPFAPKASYAQWWISPQYVNTFGQEPGYTGCQGAQGMNALEGDSLLLDIQLQEGNLWQQTVTNSSSGEVAKYTIDLRGQEQNRAIFMIEGYQSWPVSDVVFRQTVLTLSSASRDLCRPVVRGPADTMGAVRLSPDGRRCCIDEIVLRAP
jgi:hypothetical protein